MRISGGIAKGRKVGSRKAFSRGPADEELRPTSAKVREALFDILRERISGAAFLDLYAGTGAVGIEALSRGAADAVFVESDAKRVKLIEGLLREFGFGERARVVRAKAYEFVKRESAGARRYDIVFLDPPYYTGELTVVLPLAAGILKDGGLALAEHFSKMVLPETIGPLRRMKDYRYGDTKITLYRLERT